MSQPDTNGNYIPIQSVSEEGNRGERDREQRKNERIGGSMLRESNERNNKKGLDHKCGSFVFFSCVK
jgi:hypothetical protein